MKHDSAVEGEPGSEQNQAMNLSVGRCVDCSRTKLLRTAAVDYSRPGGTRIIGSGRGVGLATARASPQLPNSPLRRRTKPQGAFGQSIRL